MKVGHAGTLDPLATGLLIIAIGRATKKIDEVAGLSKEYTGHFVMGATTPSFDLETEIAQTFDVSSLTEEALKIAAQNMQGEVLQTPPIFSAKKIDGTRAYEMARKGKEVEMRKHLVNIHEFESSKVEMPNVYFRVFCSKGTYIRSIANDFGKALNNGAYLGSLRRTKIGDFKVEDAQTIEQFLASLNDQ